MRVIFCHGLESGPHGRKYRALCDAGFDVLSPDFQGLALAARVDSLIPILAAETAPFVLVGSSYGGITAVCATLREPGTVAAMVLCAPALNRTEPPADTLALRAVVPTTIIHGTGDTVIPIQVSRDFAAANPLVTLHEVDDDHRLSASRDLLVGTVYSTFQIDG